MTEQEIKAYVARGANEPMMRLALKYAAQGMAFDCAWAPELRPRASHPIPTSAVTRTTTKFITTAEDSSMPTITYDTGGRARRASTIEQVQEFRRAEAECAAFVPNTLAMDSADEIYCAALERMGVDTRNLANHPGAAAAAFRGRRSHGVPRPATAQDEKLRASRFPNAGRLG